MIEKSHRKSHRGFTPYKGPDLILPLLIALIISSEIFCIVWCFYVEFLVIPSSNGLVFEKLLCNF